MCVYCVLLYSMEMKRILCSDWLSCPLGSHFQVVFFCVFKDFDVVSVHENAKKNLTSIPLNYMAGSASGQDDANPVLPERARWAYLARLGLPALVPQTKIA